MCPVNEIKKLTDDEIHVLVENNDLMIRQSLEYARDLNSTLADLKSANEKLKESYLDTLNRLAVASEYRDENTGAHTRRIGEYTGLMVLRIGLPHDQCDVFRFAAPMHDVGKIGIPDGILLKPGSLCPEEFETMKTHCLIGARILGGSSTEILNVAETIAFTHHERWNGTGYPRGLAGEDIPLPGRITALADVFDALISPRPYKKAFSVDKAASIIREERGRHFDPELTDVFFDALDDIIAIHENSFHDTV